MHTTNNRCAESDLEHVLKKKMQLKYRVHQDYPPKTLRNRNVFTHFTHTHAIIPFYSIWSKIRNAYIVINYMCLSSNISIYLLNHYFVAQQEIWLCHRPINNDRTNDWSKFIHKCTSNICIYIQNACRYTNNETERGEDFEMTMTMVNM